MKNQVLIIVDVQDVFKQYFPSETYIEDVNKLCQKFNRVYQVWDTTKGATKPDFTFPNQVKDFSKSYDFDLKPSEVNGLIPATHAIQFYDNVYNNSLVRGDIVPMKSGEYLVYVGGKHEWFKCPAELSSLFIELGKAKTPVVFVGGAASECLLDVVVAAMAFKIECDADMSLVYGAKTGSDSGQGEQKK